MKWYAIVWRRVHYRRERERRLLFITSVIINGDGGRRAHWRPDVILFALGHRSSIRSTLPARSLSLSFSRFAVERREEKKKKGKRKKVERRCYGARGSTRKKRRKVDDRGGILSGKWTALGYRIAGNGFDFIFDKGLIFLDGPRGEVDTFQFNFCPTHRGKVLYLDIGLQEFSTRFSFSSQRNDS